ncbi:MAG: transporter related, partial [Clostridia bacterium]|nr:transporter related [Clostridia bacterium]
SGEILGIAGVDGNGQTELLQTITGLQKPTAGEVLINGKEITSAPPRTVIESGVGHIPEDRHKRGLILNFSLAENTILGSHHNKRFRSRFGLNYAKIKEHARQLIKDFDVRTPNENVAARSLSGGNQQKLIIAREVERDPGLCIAAQPTRGLDVGAIEFVHKRLVDLRDSGKAVLLVSLELDEIMSLSDRIAVMYDGKIVAVVDAKDATEKKLGILMAGGSLENQA